MRLKAQALLMQARFVEIHQVFAKKIIGYFSNRVVLNQELAAQKQKMGHILSFIFRNHGKGLVKLFYGVIVLYWWGGHCCPMHCDIFKIYCAPSNLGITRT